MTEKELVEGIEREGEKILNQAGFCRKPAITSVQETEYFREEYGAVLFCMLVLIDDRFLFRVKGFWRNDRIEYTDILYLGAE